MRILLILGLLGFLVPAGAETLTQGERDRAMSSLHATRKAFLDTTATVSEAQWTYKPSPDAWSIAEIAEHIALSEDFIFGATLKALQGQPQPDQKQAAKAKDEIILVSVPRRDPKFQAPEPLKPRQTYATRDQLAESFKKSRERNITYVRDTQDDLRAYFLPHPALGPLDAYQWILLISAHSERHVNQMKEVMASPGYPKQ